MWLLIVVALVVGSGFMLLLPSSATEVIYERGLTEGKQRVCVCVLTYRWVCVFFYALAKRSDCLV